MIEALEQFIGTARWFGGKGRDYTVTDVRPLAWLSHAPDSTDSTDSTDSGPRMRIELVSVTFEGGTSDTYQLPMSYYAEPQERLEHALVGRWEDPEAGPSFVYDAAHDREATPLLLQGFAEGREVDDLVFHRIPGHELDLTARSTLFSGEQSNSSLVFGEDSLLKLFRRVTPGHNPDIEIHEALTAADSDHVAALYGWLECRDAAGGQPLQLAMLQQFLRTASDGWGLALASVRDLFAEADLHADEVGGDFAGESHRLGVATAEVHVALAEHFPVQRWTADQLGELSAAMAERLDLAMEIVPGLADHADGLRDAFASVAAVADGADVQRVHGDYHLGQTLRTVRGWKIVDFEGEPAKPLEERVRPDSPWRDVAGMLRSFDYAAHAVVSDVEVEEGGDAQIAYRALEWVDRNQSAFLAGYAEGRQTTEGLSTDEEILLRAYVLDKAVYETVYETRNRPSWLPIPLGAVDRLLRPSALPTSSSSSSSTSPEVTSR